MPTLEQWLKQYRLSELLHKLNIIDVYALEDLTLSLSNENDIDNLITELKIEKKFIISNKLKKALIDLIGIPAKSPDTIDLDRLMQQNYAKPHSIQPKPYQNDEKFYEQNTNNPNKCINTDHAKMLSELTEKERIKLICDYNLLCGRTINDKGEIIKKSVPIFKLLSSNNKYSNHFHQDTKCNIDIRSTSNSICTQLATCGYYNVATQLEGSYNALIVKVKAKARFQTSSNNTSNKQYINDTHSFVAECTFQSGKITLSNGCLVLTKRFQNDLEKYRNNEMDKNEFHNIYGHWVDLSIIIGAKIYTIETKQITDSVDQNTQKEQLEAAFAVKVGYCNVEAGGGISGGKGNETLNQNKYRSKQITMKCQTMGGNNLLVDQNDWSLWKQSINQNNWSVIDVTEIRNVLNLTEFSGESQIANYLEKMLVISEHIDDVDLTQIKLKHIGNDRTKKLRSEEILKNLKKTVESDVIEIKMEQYVPEIGGMIYHNDSRNFHNLSYKEKRKLIIASKLLHGRTFDCNGKVIPSSYKIFNLKDDVTNEYSSHFQEINQMHQHIEIKYDEITKCLVKSGYSCNDKNIETSLKLGVYAKGGCKYGSNTDKINSSYNNKNYKDCTFIAQYIYPKGRISLNEQCLKLTPEYMTDFELLKRNKMNKTRFHQKYGHWVDLNIVIGGKIYSERSRSIRTNIEEKRERDEFANAFNMKINTCISVNGGAGCSMGKGNDNIKQYEYKHKMSSINLLVIGGNAMSINERNYTKWEESLNSTPEKWEIIEIGNTENVLSLDYYIKQYYPEKYKKLFQTPDLLKNSNDTENNNNGNLLYKIYPNIEIKHDVWCICGQKLKLCQAKYCYQNSTAIICNVCTKRFCDDKKVYHCPLNKIAKHSNGYDMCKLCAL